MNTAPMKKVIANQKRRPPTSPRSAANTPSWQVTDDSTRTIVNGAAVLRSSTTPLAGQIGSLTARIVKYIANSAAKNISSLDSHTMVPTLTTLGLVSDPWDGTFSRAVAEATRRFLQPERAPGCTTPRPARRSLSRPYARSHVRRPAPADLGADRDRVGAAGGRPRGPACGRGRIPAGGTQPAPKRRRVGPGSWPVRRRRRPGHGRLGDPRLDGRLRRHAVLGAHGPAHDAVDGLADLPGTRCTGHVGAAHAADPAPSRVAHRTAQPAGEDPDQPARRRGAGLRHALRALHDRALPGEPAVRRPAQPAARALPAGRLHLLLADHRCRSRAGPAAVPDATAAGLHRASGARVPWCVDHGAAHDHRRRLLPRARTAVGAVAVSGPEHRRWPALGGG